MRAASQEPKNFRVTCNFDFDPSQCKDYHDTGHCLFGGFSWFNNIFYIDIDFLLCFIKIIRKKKNK